MANRTPIMECKPRWIGLLLLAVYLLAGLIEPCDGHSCKGETWTTSGINTKSN